MRKYLFWIKEEGKKMKEVIIEAKNWDNAWEIVRRNKNIWVINSMTIFS